ncbi:hypothetical protein PDJAM_G00094200 [Pangasius djambal]|uniref:Uncharacterized protein n=1 Tax=Pangasius djambal TaxID=1691987 RepID=A0ACC5Z5S2_9TELE|nr:hypothetical protein [Pangasius djambal]
MPGGSAVLSCVAVGAPVPYVKWMTGEIELNREEEIPIGRNILHLTNIRESANYTCVAMSLLGTIEATAQVTVKALPKPPTSLTVTETMATSVTLTWNSENPEPVSYYMIQYRSKASDSSYQEVNRVTTTRFSISGLSPYCVYEFRVMAVNNIGRGPPSDAVETRTSEQAPSSPPLHVQARMLSSRAMLVQWEPPEEPNGQIRGYRIYYTTDPDAQLIAWLKHNTGNNRLTTISGLTTNVTYSLCVLGFTSVGDGPPSDVLQVKTLPGVPAQPSGFEAVAEPDTGIKLKWLWPVQEPITLYELHYWEAGTDNKIRVTFIPSGSYVVENLKPDTLYKFSLAARSEMGLGVFTKPIEARTAQSTPSAPPQDVQVLSLSSTSIRVSWMPPPAASRNGAIVRYTVSYQALNGEDTERHEVTDIGADATSVVLEGLGKWTEYVVRVRAHTHVGPGPESTPVHVRTKEDVPGAPPRALEVEAVNSTAIHVTWKPPLPGKQHGQIRGYQVLYFRLENGEPRGHPTIKDVVLPEAQEAIISGLNSETWYSVTVAAYTTRGDGVRSKAKVIKTKAAVPGKPTMLISITVGNAALIQWQPPKDMPGELIGYRLRYKRVNEESFMARNFRSTDNHYMATGLFKGATYSFHLSAKNRAGTGEEFVKNISTEEEVPSGFPLNLSVEGMTTTTIRLIWLPPAPAARNGQITHYVVVYRDINSQRKNTNRTSDTHVMLHDLRPDTTYDIRIQAFTSKGGGPMSPSIQSRTMATSPAFATSFRVRAVMKTSVLLTWELPENFKSQGLFKSRLSREPAARIASVCRCARFAPGRLSSRREPSLACLAVLAPLLPGQTGGYARGARRWIWRREWRRASPFLLPHPPDPLSALWVWKPALRFLPPREWAWRAACLPPRRLTWRAPTAICLLELLEVVSRAIAKLSIDWPAETRVEPQGGKLEERFPRSKPAPPSQSLPFFSDLHTEVSRSWGWPFSARLFSPASSYYANVAGLDHSGYRAMPRVEQTLASYLSPGTASFLKAPALPSKPLRTTSALVGKAYTAAGQAGACLHTMAVLQVYQADLLKELDEHVEMWSM